MTWGYLLPTEKGAKHKADAIPYKPSHTTDLLDSARHYYKDKEDKPMTVETFITTSMEQAKSVSPDRSLAAAQFETIIRAWKGETVESQGVIPMSPVGEADLDGSHSVAQSDTGKIQGEAFFPTMFLTCDTHSQWVAGCSWILACTDTCTLN